MIIASKKKSSLLWNFQKCGNIAWENTTNMSLLTQFTLIGRDWLGVRRLNNLTRHEYKFDYLLQKSDYHQFS